MKNIDEAFLHFLWQNQQFSGVVIVPVEEFKIKVIDPGSHNHDSGPDFFNAKVEIDNTLWAGNIELHINASDWIKHGHSEDSAYDSVILHIVYFDDCIITRNDGSKIPTAVIRFPNLMHDKYRMLQKSRNWISCEEHLKSIEPVHLAQWTSSLMIQKLMEKVDSFRLIKNELHSHWDAILSRIIFRSFGIPVNTTPFEMLSVLVPYPILLRNKENEFTLEAILFGQAGMLQSVLPNDKYTENLKQEFSRFTGKLCNHQVPVQSWKYMRMRPNSFPSIRIAQLAALINHLYPFHSYLETLPSINDLRKLFRIKAGDYWNNHFQLGKESKTNSKYIGNNFISQIIINSIVPYAFFYGKMNKNDRFCDYAIGLLEFLPAEENKILKKWDNFGIKYCNAFESQALLYLYNNYCKHRRCLNCQFGNTIILDGAKKEK